MHPSLDTTMKATSQPQEVFIAFMGGTGTGKTTAPRTHQGAKPTVAGSQENQSRGRPPGVKEEYSIELHEGDIVPRTHYRVLFREVCEPLHDVQDLGKAYSLINQTCDVLRILHGHRMVHGDLSTGNILNHNGKVKLADLEYSRFIDEEGTPSFRTGTAEFMSVEVERRIRVFKPNEEFISMDVAAVKNVVVKPFRYGMTHDLESLWWIAVWFLFRTHPTGTTVDPRIEQMAGTVFSRNENRLARRDLISSAEEWSSATADLPPQFLDASMHLDLFRRHYVQMATTTYLTLSAKGVAEKISTAHLQATGEQLDAYAVAQAFLKSTTLPISLTTPSSKRKDAPELEHPEPGEPSKRTRQQ